MPITDQASDGPGFSLPMRSIKIGRFSVDSTRVIEVRDEPDIDFDVDVYVAYSDRLKRSVAVAVTALSREDGPEITGTSLRAIRVSEYMAACDPWVSYDPPEDAPAFGWLPKTMQELVDDARSDEATWEQEKFYWTYVIYRFAQIKGSKPAKEVEAKLRVPPRTASRWISRARELGYFDETAERFDG